MKDRLFPKGGILCQNGVAFALLPVEQKSYIVVPFKRLGGTGYGNIWAEIATHDVNCNSDHSSLILLAANQADFARKYLFRLLLQ